MKRIYYLIIPVFLSLTSCDKLMYLANINITLPYSEKFSIPAPDTLIPLPPEGITYSLPPITVETNMAEELEERNMEEEQIKKIYLKNFSQKISGGTINFNFADSIRVYLKAKGLPEILVAYNNKVPKDIDSISFDCTDENLESYFIQDSISMRMEGHFLQMHPQANYRADFSFVMTATPAKE